MKNQKEMAAHNGVDVSYWGNNPAKIQVPQGWEDHQHTQQLIRKYLTDDKILFSIEQKKLEITISEEEFSILSPRGHRAEFCNLGVRATAQGFCLEKYVGREAHQDSLMVMSIDDNSGFYYNKNSIFEKIIIKTK